MGLVLVASAGTLGAQQLTRFVNNETGVNVPGNGQTGAAPWRTITYALSQVTLTPTQNLILNIAGRLNAAGAEIPYDAANGESFPILLPARWMLTYDTVNSELTPGGARVPVRIESPPGIFAIQIVATAGTNFDATTGLDGVVPGERLLRVRGAAGGNVMLVRADGPGAANKASLKAVTLEDGDGFTLCLEARDGGQTLATVTDATIRTTLPFFAGRSLLKVFAFNPTVLTDDTSVTVSLTTVDLGIGQVGGVPTGYAEFGIEAVAGALGGSLGGDIRVTVNTRTVAVQGDANEDPLNPVGIDKGMVFESSQPGGLASMTATVSGGRVVDCGITGIQGLTGFTGIGSGSADSCSLTVSGVEVQGCGKRANTSNLLEGHGIAFEGDQGNALTGRVENCLVSGNFQDGVFAWVHDMLAGGSGLVTVQSNEIGYNLRNGVKILAQNGAALSSASAILSNRIHHSVRGIHNAADQSGCVSSPSIVNNVIYRNTTNGILNEAVQAGSVAGPTMTHNTVAETGAVGVLVQGAGTTSGASFWNGISYHVGSPGPTDLSGFADFQINFSSFLVTTTVNPGQGNTNAAPDFVDENQDNYHLDNPASNLLVDVATNSPPAVPQFDFEGNLRQLDLGATGPAGQYADMGADEATP